MTRPEAVARARSAIGSKCAYRLGKGGFSPTSPYPWNSAGECDCSGFIAWCLGVSRHTDNPWYKSFNGGWVETSAIVRDAKVPFGFFDEVTWEHAAPGHLIVYGDFGGHQGHVGIVNQADNGPTQAIHCSNGNFTRTQDAIQETGIAVWKMHEGIIVRCAFLEEMAG